MIKIDEKEGLVYLGIDDYEGLMKKLEDIEFRLRRVENKVIGV